MFKGIHYIFLAILVIAIVVLSVLLANCRKKNNTTDTVQMQMKSRAKPMHPAHAAYQKFLRGVNVPEYEYKMYEAYTHSSDSQKKYSSPSLEAYTLADYDKVQNCSCKTPATCIHGKTRGWSPSSDTI